MPCAVPCAVPCAPALIPDDWPCGPCPPTTRGRPATSLQDFEAPPGALPPLLVKVSLPSERAAVLGSPRRGSGRTRCRACARAAAGWPSAYARSRRWSAPAVGPHPVPSPTLRRGCRSTAVPPLRRRLPLISEFSSGPAVALLSPTCVLLRRALRRRVRGPPPAGLCPSACACSLTALLHPSPPCAALRCHPDRSTMADPPATAARTGSAWRARGAWWTLMTAAPRPATWLRRCGARGLAGEGGQHGVA